jgi:hypothetical protein
LAALVFAFTLGCTKAPKTRDLSPEELHLQKFSKLYYRFKEDQTRPPADVQTLKTWAKKKLKKNDLADLGIDDLDQAVTSPRDHQPYEIVNLPMGMGPLLAYEKNGVDGKRLCLNGGGSIMEVNEDTFKELLESTPGGPPPETMPPGMRPFGKDKEKDRKK